MGIRKSLQQMWHTLESGVIIPQGSVSNLSLTSSENYLRIKEKALAVEQIYLENNILLADTSDLARLLADARTLSDSWLLGENEKCSTKLLFRVAHFNRIADAIIPLRSEPNSARYLTSLASGSLDFLQRKKSNAKDILWELELYAILKLRTFDVILEDPPDIIVKFGNSKIGIACKKLYSEKHIQNVLSQAVAQIEASFDFGIVALNIDDLVPANQILKIPTQETMSEYISNLNTRFINAHQRHFRKYLASGRVISAIISTSVLADCYTAQTRFNNARQSLIWTIPGLPSEKDLQLKNFYNRLMA
jgi:hypothetical protein